MSAMLFSTSVQAFCFNPCSLANAFAKAPFVIGFAPAFIDFIGGNMAKRTTNKADAIDEQKYD